MITDQQWSIFVDYCLNRLKREKDGFSLYDKEMAGLFGITHPFYERINELGSANHPGFNTNYNGWTKPHGNPSIIIVTPPGKISTGQSVPPDRSMWG